MSQRSRICMAASVIALLTLAGAAAGGPDRFEQRKQEVVRAALERQGRATMGPAISRAVERAGALFDIEMNAADPALITLRSTGRPVCEAFTLDNGQRLVIDLYNTVNLRSGEKLVPAQRSLVQQVRTSLFAVEPQFVSRVVLDLAAPCTFDMRQDSQQVTVDLTRSGQSLSTPPTLSDAIEKTAQELTRQKARIQITLASLEETAQRTQDALKEEEAPVPGAAQPPAEPPAAPAVPELVQDATASPAPAVEAARPAYQEYGVTMDGRVAALQAALEKLQCEVEGDEASETEAWAALRMLQDGMVRTNQEDLQLRGVLAPAPPPALSPAATQGDLVRQLGEELNRLKQEQRPLTPAVTVPAPGRPGLLDFQEMAALSGAVRRQLAAGIVSAVEAGNWARQSLDGFAADVSGPMGRLQLAQAELVHVDESPRPVLMDQRIAELTTELEAVTITPINLPNTLAPALAYVDGEPPLVVLEQERPAPPGRRPAIMGPGAVNAMRSVLDTAVGNAATAGGASAGAASVKPSTRIQKTYQPVSELTAVPAGARPSALPPTQMPPPQEPDVILPSSSGDPLDELVNIDFRDMDLSQVVGLLAEKAGINVVAGIPVTGKVTARLNNVPLRQAMETALKLNDLGLLEENGIYRIVPYDDVVASQRVTRIVELENAQANELKKTLGDLLIGLPNGKQVNISANESTNVLILSGPEAMIAELASMASQLDVAEPTLPTVTEAIKLNYAKPKNLLDVVKGLISKEGSVAADELSRSLIVTEVPVKLEQIRELVLELDTPFKQVVIDTMIVDAVLDDSAETGTDWILNAVRKTNRRGNTIGNLAALGMQTDVTGAVVTPDIITQSLTSGRLNFSLLSSRLNMKGIISAQVKSNNARLLANPVVVTMENKEASITISREIPYQELKQSLTGPPMSTTSFKEVGTVLKVTPSVTNDNHIVVDLDAKQSDTKGEFNGVPIEDKRQTKTSLLAGNAQTIFIGGLRRFDEDATVDKVPVLGDIPVVNFLFRHNSSTQECTELLIFLTCKVLEEEIPDLSPRLQEKYDQLGNSPIVPNAQKEAFRSILHPNEIRDPLWRRSVRSDR